MYNYERQAELFMDGESGTWRLFVTDPENPHGQCVDLTLDGLAELHTELGRVISQIESDPDQFNAEVRANF